MWRFHFFGGSKYGDYKKFLIMSQLWAIFSVALAWMWKFIKNRNTAPWASYFQVNLFECKCDSNHRIINTTPNKKKKEKRRSIKWASEMHWPSIKKNFLLFWTCPMCFNPAKLKRILEYQQVDNLIIKDCGEVGYRSPYLSHAKRALYHLSYIPSSWYRLVG